MAHISGCCSLLRSWFNMLWFKNQTRLLCFHTVFIIDVLTIFATLLSSFVSSMRVDSLYVHFTLDSNNMVHSCQIVD